MAGKGPVVVSAPSAPCPSSSPRSSRRFREEEEQEGECEGEGDARRSSTLLWLCLGRERGWWSGCWESRPSFSLPLHDGPALGLPSRREGDGEGDLWSLLFVGHVAACGSQWIRHFHHHTQIIIIIICLYPVRHAPAAGECRATAPAPAGRHGGHHRRGGRSRRLHERHGVLAVRVEGKSRGRGCGSGLAAHSDGGLFFPSRDAAAAPRSLTVRPVGGMRCARSEQNSWVTD